MVRGIGKHNYKPSEMISIESFMHNLLQGFVKRKGHYVAVNVGMSVKELREKVCG